MKPQLISPTRSAAEENGGESKQENNESAPSGRIFGSQGETSRRGVTFISDSHLLVDYTDRTARIFQVYFACKCKSRLIRLGSAGARSLQWNHELASEHFVD